MMRSLAPMIDRRQLLALSLICATYIFVNHSVTAQGVMKLTLPNDQTEISVVVPGDADFEPLISKLLDSAALPVFRKVEPLSMIVVNKGERYIWGFTVVYTYPSQISPSGRPRQNVKHISPGGAGAGRKEMLAPGGVYLVTPLSEVSAALDASQNVTLRPYAPHLDEALAEYNKRSLPLNPLLVTSAIDSVIYEDGTIEGPDTKQWMYKLNSRYKAESYLRNSLDASLTDDALRSTLKGYLMTQGTDEYSHALSAHAQFLLGLLNSEGRQAFDDLIAKARSARLFQDSDTVRRRQ